MSNKTHLFTSSLIVVTFCTIKISKSRWKQIFFVWRVISVTTSYDNTSTKCNKYKSKVKIYLRAFSIVWYSKLCIQITFSTIKSAKY